MKKKEIILTLSEEDRAWLEKLIQQLVSSKDKTSFRDKIKRKGIQDDRKEN